MNFSIEPYCEEKHSPSFLEEMLYEAIWVGEQNSKLPRKVVKEASLSRYVSHWGRDGDFALVAMDQTHQKPIGAIWLRLFEKENAGFGFVAEDVPEISMAVSQHYRGQGIGTALLRELIDWASKHYSQVSLSVDPKNPALELYQKFGFTVSGATGSSKTMTLDLS